MDIPEEAVNRFDDLDYDGVEEDAEEIMWVHSEMTSFAEGLADGSRAWSHVSLGFYHFEEDDWIEGEGEFDMAHSAFGTGVDAPESVHPDLLVAMTVHFDEVLCEIGSGQDASTYWIEAAEAAQEDDQDTRVCGRRRAGRDHRVSRVGRISISGGKRFRIDPKGVFSFDHLCKDANGAVSNIEWQCSLVWSRSTLVVGRHRAHHNIIKMPLYHINT